MTYDQILKAVEKKEWNPIYYLYGDETYFVDKLTSLIEKNVVTESEASFNKNVFFGADATANQILNACRSFPVMANQRLVVVKEAQKLGKGDKDKLTAYLKQPASSTVLVLSFKGPRATLPKAGADAVKAAKGVTFYAKKMWERDIKAWVAGYITSQGFTADPGVADALVANLGLNLGHLENEMEKMMVYLKAIGKNKLEKDYVFDTINIDKEFNVFELINALGLRKTKRCHLIIDRMTQNAKLNPPVMIVGGLFRYFHQIAQVYSHKLTDANSIKSTLHFNYYQAMDSLNGKRNFSLGAVYRNIGFIHEADLMLKGQISTQMNSSHILKTLVWRLLN